MEIKSKKDIKESVSNNIIIPVDEKLTLIKRRSKKNNTVRFREIKNRMATRIIIAKVSQEVKKK